ncbi:hypothetical protein C8R47DRAFT_1227880 [Mycena vitilis]|nr:hypothetical protein C8R47DRAFT_1227880 [Mycena vitilis]
MRAASIRFPKPPESRPRGHAELDSLVHDVILHEDFDAKHLEGFSVVRENKRLDDAAAPKNALAGQPPMGWSVGSVKLKLPAPKVCKAEEEAAEFEVTGIGRSSTSWTEAFTSSAFEQFHTTPFEMRWDPNHSHDDPDVTLGDINVPLDKNPPLPRVCGEIYTSSRMLQAHNALPQTAEPHFETIIAAYMFWSDSTHWALKGLFHILSSYHPTTVIMSANSIPSSSSSAPSSVSSSSTVATTSSGVPISESTKRKLLVDELTGGFPTTTAPKKKRGRSPKCSLAHSWASLILSRATRTTAERLEHLGKLFVGAVNPYMDIADALQYGCDLRWGTVDASNTIRIPASELVRQDACVAALDAIFRGAEDLLDVVKHLFLQISEDDTDNWDKLHCAHYVLPDAMGQALPLPPAIRKSDDKSDCGLSHPILRYCILGWADRAKLSALVIPTAPNGRRAATVADTDLRFLQRIVAGSVELTAVDFPSFFWAEGSYDPEDLDNGLLRGPLLPLVLRYTAPTSALNGLDKGIPAICNARAHTILSTKQWDVRDGAYNYEKMFDAVVKPFSGLPNDPWAVETLQWFQE